MNASGKMLNSIDKLDAAINAIKNKGEQENLSPLVHNLSVVEHSLMNLVQRLNLIQGLIGITARAAKRRLIEEWVIPFLYMFILVPV